MQRKLTDQLKIDMTRDAGLNRETRGKIPACKVQCGADDQVRDLGDCLSSDESYPVVNFRLSCVSRSRFMTDLDVVLLPYLLFPRFEEIAIVKKERLHLINAPRSNKDQIASETGS